MIYAHRTKQYLQKLIKQRMHLPKNHTSRKNEAQLSEYCGHLQRCLEYNRYNDQQMARFVRRHFTKIMYIAPGEGAANHKAVSDELTSIYQQATELLKQIEHATN